MKKNTELPAISPLMHDLSGYLAAAGRRRLPQMVADKTKQHIADTLAAMISGARLAPGRIAISYVKSLGGTRQSCIPGTRLVTSAQNAALANGMTAHADETDDSHQPAFFHPGCAVVPAALAMAEARSASGAAFVNAVALGYDVGARMNLALGAMNFHLAGRSTHSYGALFGAAAAAGALARLDAQQMRWLMSYTAQQASGVSCWMRDSGHIEKAFDFGGMPARNGVAAAMMVASGMSGVDDVLAGERNLLFAHEAEGRSAALTRGLGVEFEIMNANIKKWSVGSPIQAALDSIEALIREHAIAAKDVDKVEVKVQDHEAAVVDNRDMPDVCLQHLVAIMLLDGTITFASAHDERRMHDRRVLALRQRIRLEGSAELTHSGGRQAIVEIHLHGGRTLSHHTRAVRGTTGNPMTHAEVEAKCADLMSPVLGARRTRRLIDALWNLEEARDIRKLRPLLQA